MHTLNVSRLSARQVVPCRKQPAVPAPAHQHVRFASRISIRKQLDPLVVRAIAEPPLDALEETDMFCYQCEQTLHGEGCTSHGVCGKTAETAALQDLLNYQLKGLSAWAVFAHKNNIPTPEVDSFVKAAIFSTLTNVNFDSERFREYCLHCHDLTVGLKKQLQDAGIQGAPAAPELPWFDIYGNPIYFDLMKATCGDVTVEAFYKVADQVSLANRGSGWPTSLDILKPTRENVTVPALHNVADQVSLAHRRVVMKDQATLLGLHELLTYGLRGMAAYAHHAEMLGEVDASIDDFCEQVMAFLASEESKDPAQVLNMCMALGAENFKVMAMLDHAHTSRYGNPVPTEVPITPVEGKAILISGHDMHDLEDLLRQTEGLGINVYTHGEMLPGHGYPGLNKYKHLVGNYGGAWYRQRVDFANFPGPILMTTNCIVDPTPAYADRIFTTGEVGVKAAAHLATKDFSPVIAKALELPGFTYVPEEKKSVHVGFGHNTVLSVADQVLGAVSAGQLSHIFVIGGCDNFEKERKYYTEVAKGLPQDTMVLTLGCGKYRFYDHDFGTLANGLPRLLDMGQCNDAYSALVVATKLAEALNTDVNSLPLSLDISWFEQKAVAVLLTLLHLGIKNIRLGPNLPAFVTPDALNYLVEHFNIMPADTHNPLKDIDRMMANA